jgi:drug/metabolite transporter (DMT)-like permease
MLAWATLPIALAAMLRDLDPLTLTWFRFLAASVTLGTILGARGSLLGPKSWMLPVFATACMAANYLLYLLGLDMTTPANTQIVIQACPLLFSLGAIAIYGAPHSKTSRRHG